MNIEEMRDQFVQWYGDRGDGPVPQPGQWARILGRPPEDPVTLINFFKFRDLADYGHGEESTTGQAAFEKYTAVSIPGMARAGGTFLMVAPFEATLIGPEEDWDLVAVGSYPNLQAFLDLYRDEAYRAAFRHRSAACARQKVLLAAA